MTAVYVPDRKQLGNSLDLILYFHGWKGTSGLTIQDYLKDPDFALRDFILKQNKRKFILVAPTLGDKAGFGLLGNSAMAKAYLEQVLNGVHKHLLGGTGTRPTIGRIVLAAHSGGGAAMRTLAGFANLDSLIHEVWCFDCTYGGGQSWAGWATKAGHTLDRLWVFSTGSWDKEVEEREDPKKPEGPDNPVVTKTKRTGTGDDARVIPNAAKKKKLANVEVLIKPVPPNSNKTATFTYGVAAGHNESVGFYFSQLIKSSKMLS
jgi:hypothetical protein